MAGRHLLSSGSYGSIRLRRRLRKLPADVFKFLGKSSPVSANARQLVFDSTVMRQLFGEVVNLLPDDIANRHDDDECRAHDDQHRRNAWQARPLEPGDQRREDKGEQHGQRDGDQHFLGDVQRRDRDGDRR